MRVLGEIAATWRDPAAALRRRIAAGPREDRALAVLMAAAGLIFLSQWPRAARAARLDPSAPLDARLAGALMASLFLLPLLAYGLAGASHLLARLLGGRGSGFGARVALFWALLATAPLMLVQGFFSGLAGPGAASAALGLLVFAAFLWLWLAGLREAERGNQP